MRLMKELKGGKRLMKIDLEENMFKRFLCFLKKFKHLPKFIFTSSLYHGKIRDQKKNKIYEGTHA